MSYDFLFLLSSGSVELHMLQFQPHFSFSPQTLVSIVSRGSEISESPLLKIQEAMKVFRFLTLAVTCFIELSNTRSIPERTAPALANFSSQRHVHLVEDNLIYSRDESASAKSQIIQNRVRRSLYPSHVAKQLT